MNQIEHNFNNYLPLNRKERFFTGTVLPSIICYENFKYIDRFLRLINGFPKDLIIKSDSMNSNIQFMTEYSLNESANFSGKKILDVPTSKETPDMVILFTEPALHLIVVEAKMYSSSKTQDFKTQIEGQKKIIASIQKTLSIESKHIFHIGLVPKDYFNYKIDLPAQLIYWEDILLAYKDILSNNYFYETLRFALTQYKTLVSSNNSAFATSGKNMEDKLSGKQIIELVELGKSFWVGRHLGIDGEKLRKDMDTGNWVNFIYEVNFSFPVAPNRNWFSARDFFDYAKSSIQIETKSHSETDIIENPWHFSYLGTEYFLNIAAVLRFGRSLQCPIDLVYVGKLGVPYIEKIKGRQVNPNWCVVLKDRREFKYSKGKLSEGLWNPSNCIKFLWEDIKNYPPWTTH